MKRASTQQNLVDDHLPLWAAGLSSPILWGGVLTVGFYALIPYLPVQRELTYRYFCSHPIEYATTLLFFIGMAILARKAIAAQTEKASLRLDLAEPAGQRAPQSAAEWVDHFEQNVRRLPVRLRRTFLCRRIVDACSYARDRGQGAAVEEHLKSLADLCADQLHRSYALVRTVTWAVPILGFLGTVIGITFAIANVTPDQLDSSLSSVTGGLAVAFDTTALALGLSLILVFTSFIVERSEQQILSDVEEFAIKRLATCLASGPTQHSGPLASAEAEAARQLLDRTESLIDWQTKLWQEALESTRQAWSQTLVTQQQELDTALQSGMAATLSNHAAQLDTVRSEFLQAFQTVAADMAQHRAGWVQAQQQLDTTFRENTQRFLQELSAELLALRDCQASDVDRLTQTLSQRVGEWQEQLQAATQANSRQLEELRRQGELLLQIVGQESELARLETRLSENLEVVRAAETFEETMHNLSAAVNLLTARARPRAA